MKRRKALRWLFIATFPVCMSLYAHACPQIPNPQVNRQSERTDGVWHRTLIVDTQDGQTQEFVMEKGTRVGTVGVFLEITSNGQRTYIMLDEVKQFRYGRILIPTGATTPSTEAVPETEPFTLTEDGELLFTKLKEGSVITVYNLDGQQLLNRRIEKAAPFTLSLSALKAGVYIVKINHHTYKIQK